MTITLFIVSLLVLSGLVASKVFEIKVRRINFLSNIFVAGDNKIRSLINTIIFKYNRYRKILHIFVFDFLPSYLYELLVKMKDFVARKYYKAGDSIRGRRILKSNGSVSSFLEQISEDKTVEKKS